ncbi:MAG: ribonuclease T2 [Crocosphaera sp.]|nr:ribonuclease T2 [Crocosphaera sp.]
MKHLKKGLLLLIVCVYCITFFITPAIASVKLNGTFVTEKSCEAFSSIRRKTNPGNVLVKQDETYEVLAKNKEDATHYLIRINGVEPTTRWVAVDCGKITDEPSSPVVISNDDYLLALSWQPAFCETRPTKTECLTEDTNTFEASHFVLHGLWPQPRSNVYCGVSQEIINLDKDSSKWLEMPPIQLSADTRNELTEKMPGVASGLHLHEWYKHGTCYSESPEEYYQESLALLDQVNESPVRDLFVENLGKELNATEIREPFVVAFGENAGNKIAVKCKTDQDGDRNNMITEVWINLEGEIDEYSSLNQLLENADNARLGSCQGEIDPAPVNEA